MLKTLKNNPNLMELLLGAAPISKPATSISSSEAPPASEVPKTPSQASTAPSQSIGPSTSTDSLDAALSKLAIATPQPKMTNSASHEDTLVDTQLVEAAPMDVDEIPATQPDSAITHLWDLAGIMQPLEPAALEKIVEPEAPAFAGAPVMSPPEPKAPALAEKPAATRVTATALAEKPSATGMTATALAGKPAAAVMDPPEPTALAEKPAAAVMDPPEPTALAEKPAVPVKIPPEPKASMSQQSTAKSEPVADMVTGNAAEQSTAKFQAPVPAGQSKAKSEPLVTDIVMSNAAVEATAEQSTHKSKPPVADIVMGNAAVDATAEQSTDKSKPPVPDIAIGNAADATAEQSTAKSKPPVPAFTEAVKTDHDSVKEVLTRANTCDLMMGKLPTGESVQTEVYMDINGVKHRVTVNMTAETASKAGLEVVRGLSTPAVPSSSSSKDDSAKFLKDRR